MTASAAAGLSPLGKAFFGSLCAGTFGLGCWQTQRFFEKKELVKKNEHDLSLPPIPLSESGNDLTSLRRRLVNGTFQHNREILVGPRGPPPGAMASTGPSSGRSEGGMSSGPQVYIHKYASARRPYLKRMYASLLPITIFYHRDTLSLHHSRVPMERPCSSTEVGSLDTLYNRTIALLLLRLKHGSVLLDKWK
jgi:hypothetical protein